MKRHDLDQLFSTYLNRLPTEAEISVHLEKPSDEFKVELLNCDEYKRRGKPMQREELKELFNTYLNRNPSDREYQTHGKKKYEEFKQEILNCAEYKTKYKVSIQTNYKIAFLLSGHIRNNNIVNSLNNIINQYSCDVFIHTWDTIGKKGKETDLNDSNAYNVVVTNINRIRNVREFTIENNSSYIETVKQQTQDATYFNYSSPEIFIKSQLYSIYSSYKLMENYSKKHKIQYDIVFRLRFDCELTLFNITQNLINDVIHNKIIFVPNRDCGHHHMDSDSTSCWACDRMYHTHGLRSVHAFEHTNVICDIFAYGNQKSMKQYCSLYLDYDKLNSLFIKNNLKYLDSHNIEYTKNQNVYKIKWNKLGHLQSLYYLYCSYPERLLQVKLKDYMLVESRTIKVKFKR